MRLSLNNSPILITFAEIDPFVSNNIHIFGWNYQFPSFLLSRAMYSLSMDFFQIGLFRALSASFGSTMLSFSEIIKLSSRFSGCALMAK